MVTIVTRAGKGSELTHAEVDANFNNLNSGKADQSTIDPVAKSQATPSLDLNFTGPGAEIGTFARASTGTYFDATGVMRTAAVDTPRYDHDPATGECMGLLIESAATNSLIASQVFDGPEWGRSDVIIIPNAAVAPDGTTTANKFVEAAGGSLCFIFGNEYAAINTVLTFSVFAKAAELSSVKLHMANFDNAAVDFIFDLVNGVIGNSGVGGTDYTSPSAGIQDCGNGWFRCWITATKGSYNSVNRAVILGTSPTGDGTSGFYIWGAQLEVGPYASSYIPTAGSPVSRAPDIYNVSTVGWLRQGMGTIYADYDLSVSGQVYPRVYTLSDGTEENMIVQNGWTDVPTLSLCSVITGGVGQSYPSGPGGYGGVKTMLAYADDDFAFSSNGSSPLVDAGGTVPTGLTTLVIGGPFFPSNGHIKRLIYWPQRLSNTKLQEITS